MTKRLKTDPMPPSSVRSECPKEVDRVILRAMHRDPEARYQSAREMYEDLERLPIGRTVKRARSNETSTQNGSHVGQMAGDGRTLSAPSTTLNGEAEGHPGYSLASRGANGNSDSGTVVSGMSANGMQEIGNPNAFSGGGRSRSRRVATDEDAATEFRGQLGKSNGQGNGHDSKYNNGKYGDHDGRDGTAEYDGVIADEISEPEQMERLLGAPPATVIDTWDESPERPVLGGAIDADRMKRLAHRLDLDRESPLMDVLAVILAVAFGAGVAYGGFRLYTAVRYSGDDGKILQSTSAQSEINNMEELVSQPKVVKGQGKNLVGAAPEKAVTRKRSGT